MSSSTDLDIELGHMPPFNVDDQLEPPLPRQVDTSDQNACGRCCGRVFKDWTQVVGGLLTLVGFGGAATGIVMEDYRVALSAAGVVLVSTVLLCVRISCLKPKKELERQVEHFSGEVDRLTRNEQKLKTSKAELQRVLGEAQTSIQELGRKIKVPVDRIEGISEKFEAIEEKLSVLVDLYHRYKAAAKAFSSDLKAFKQNKKITAESVSRLKKTTKDLSLVEDELSEEVDEYQEAGEFHRQQNAELREILAGFRLDFLEMRKRFQLLRSELEKLRQHALKLDEADDKFRTGGSDFKEGVERAREELIPSLQSALQRLNKVLGELAEDSEKSVTEEGDFIVDKSEDSDGEVKIVMIPVEHQMSGSVRLSKQDMDVRDKGASSLESDEGSDV